MVFYKKFVFHFLIIIPFFAFSQTNSGCGDVTISSATANGSYTVNSIFEGDGIRDGNDYYGSTIYYPENTIGLFQVLLLYLVMPTQN